MGMRMPGLALLALATLALADPVSARGESEAVAFRTAARVTIDGTGQPVRVQGSERLPAPIREFVESTVSSWRFGPVLVDGEAREGVTFVDVGVCAAPRDGDLALAARYLRHGPGQADGSPDIPAPRYPASAVRGGVEASVVVSYVVEPDGSATLEGIEFQDRGPGRYRHNQMRREFERALGQWVAGMQYLPEQLAGQPVATRMSVPVEFGLDMRSQAAWAKDIIEQQRASPECVAAEGRLAPWQPATVQSPFSLREAATAAP